MGSSADHPFDKFAAMLAAFRNADAALTQT